LKDERTKRRKRRDERKTDRHATCNMRIDMQRGEREGMQMQRGRGDSEKLEARERESEAAMRMERN
jgi:hypothetical protein